MAIWLFEWRHGEVNTPRFARGQLANLFAPAAQNLVKQLVLQLFPVLIN